LASLSEQHSLIPLEPLIEVSRLPHFVARVSLANKHVVFPKKKKERKTP